MPEEMPRAMIRAEVDPRNVPCSRTIRRAEEGKSIRLRYRFGLAQFFDVPVTKLFPSSERQTCRVG